MGAIRSVLWIGAAKDFPAGPLSEAPRLDVVWERDLTNVRGLPDAFDAVVLDAADADAAPSSGSDSLIGSDLTEPYLSDVPKTRLVLPISAAHQQKWWSIL
jgi:hypothetical protein